ncbi:hypothetical protein POVCU1_067680 [Plasmodium ovale curtisi]|uniref:Uncharacterized protein n=1 Tax=Plasmodium ovale curtisi TaxID=864141 RepID=A0A1A8XAA2_PLAOA|nr:hypothetical protein POVCU1_067680 [Plasmodium ovale curtisi]
MAGEWEKRAAYPELVHNSERSIEFTSAITNGKKGRNKKKEKASEGKYCAHLIRCLITILKTFCAKNNEFVSKSKRCNKRENSTKGGGEEKPVEERKKKKKGGGSGYHHAHSSREQQNESLIRGTPERDSWESPERILLISNISNAAEISFFEFSFAPSTFTVTVFTKYSPGNSGKKKKKTCGEPSSSNTRILDNRIPLYRNHLTLLL